MRIYHFLNKFIKHKNKLGILVFNLNSKKILFLVKYELILCYRAHAV